MTEDDADGVAPSVIRKYSNRRLYNTATAGFVTLEDIHGMVVDGVAFRVEDAETGADITCSILAQIISDRESKGHNMLPLNYLRGLLQAYDAGLGPQFRAWLEQSVDAFTANREELARQMQDMLDAGGPGEAMERFAEIGRRNVEMFRRSMSAFVPPAAAGDGPPPSRADEIESLRQQLADLQKRLDTLSGGQ